jgi:hypothetical protein
VFLHDKLVSVSEVVVCAMFPFTNVDLADGGVFACGVIVTYEARFQ